MDRSDDVIQYGIETTREISERLEEIIEQEIDFASFWLGGIVSVLIIAGGGTSIVEGDAEAYKEMFKILKLEQEANK